MIIRIVRMTFQEDKVRDFRDNFESNREKIRNFPGCRYLELWQDAHHQNIFVTYSHWESEEALDQYRDSELFKTVWGYTRPCLLQNP